MRSAAAAVLCSASLLLLAVLPTHAQNTTTPPAPSPSPLSSPLLSPLPSACVPAMCGPLRIAYPFWLDGAHAPECGYRAFKVACDTNGTATLKNSIWMYQVLNISYADSSFMLANDFLSDDGACDFEQIPVNVSSDIGLSPFNISKHNQELLFLYDCTTLPPRPPPAWAPVSCADGLGSNVSSSFAWLAGGYRPDDAWRAVEGSCTVSTMPVLGFKGATGKDYRRLMEDGFRLEYSYTADDCAVCEGGGGFCRVNTTLDTLECHCADGVSYLFYCDGN